MSSLPPDPYKTLGVSKDAQLPEIRAAHRKLVLKCHPDKVHDPALKAQKADEFQKVQQAYELLSDENERQKYDDQVRLAELREQMRSKANTSAPRTTARYSPEYEVRTAEPRPSPYKSQSIPVPQSSKTYTFARSWEEGPRIVEAEIRYSPPRRETYAERPERERMPKRDFERERDLRERDMRDQQLREQQLREQQQREREKAARDKKRAEKDESARREKDARREKKKQEKERDKDRKRDSEDKKRHAKPYIESLDDEAPPVKEKKKSSSKKHDERRERERSLHREEIPVAASMPPPPTPPRSWNESYDYAANYIQRSKDSVHPGLARSATFHSSARQVQPPAPTPPPAPGQDAPFSPPTRPRRGSAETPRDKAFRASSRDVMDDPHVVNVSPRQFPKPATTPMASGSPPHRDLPRTSTMPIDPASYPRPIPTISRSQTYSGAFPDADRGRHRTRMHSQIPEEDTDSEYEEDRRRDRKHRSSKKQHSPEPAAHHIRRYQYEDGQAKLQTAYSRHIEPDSYKMYYAPGVRVVEGRPQMAPREASYPATSSFPKFKQSKTYSYDDVQYSNYQPREDYAYA